MAKGNPVEVLYVAESSLDDRGKRVLVREAEIENCIWPEDGVQDVDLRLLGISETDRTHIERFFGSVV